MLGLHADSLMVCIEVSCADIMAVVLTMGCVSRHHGSCVVLADIMVVVLTMGCVSRHHGSCVDLVLC